MSSDSDVSAAGSHPAVRQCPHGDVVLAALAGLFVAKEVGESAGGNGYEPGAWLVGHPLLGPPLGGGNEGFLHRVLGEIEVSVATHHRAEDLRRKGAKQVLDHTVSRGVVHSTRSANPSIIGRTSTYAPSTSPGPGLFVICDAISVARSKLSHSTMV